MKGFLTIVTLLISGVALEAPAPYAPSGWRPAGPSFELPERTPLDPRNKTPQKQEFLPPNQIPNQEYGPPEDDVSVQGLPTQEQLPIFQLSPVNGQQFVGSHFNTDLKNLEQNQRESQLQAQQAIYREFARQRQLEAFANAQRQANQQVPRQLVPRTSTTTTLKPDDFKTTTETSTESLNQGEVADDKKDKVYVEVSKQNIQEYHPELFLDPIVQLSLQQQVSPVQLGQLRAPIFLEPVQQQTSAKYAALTALVAQQQQLLQLQQSQLVQQQPQAEPQIAKVQPQFVQPQSQYAPVPAPQYQPANQYDAPVQVAATMQSAQPIFLQPQANQLLPRPQDQQVDEENEQQPQVVYYQPTQYQTEQQPINQYQQPLNSYQAAIQPQLLVQDPAYQQQLAQQQFYQQQLAQQQLAQQQLAQQQLAQQQLAQQQLSQHGQGSLQSGLEANQPGNGIEQDRDDDNEDNDGTTATAVATAFGTRTQPRVYLTYGAPVPVPRVQANPGYQTTTEAQDESATDGPTVAEATAIARGERRRPARLRSRPSRVRPIFTLDKSGHLILAQEQ